MRRAKTLAVLNGWATRWIRGFFLTGIRGYQKVLSPLWPSSCRFYPTCSEYTLQAIEAYGVSRGLWLFVKRIIRCHPCCPGGYDPLP
jgi:hypothetical protein